MRGCCTINTGDPNYRLVRKRGPGCGFRFLVLIAILMAIGFSGAGRREISHAAAPIARQFESVGAQSYVDDVVVVEGQTLDGDVVVYRGDVTVESGGTIDGSLVLYRGNVEIQDEALVSGDVTVWRGDIEVDGKVTGNVSAMRGDIDLGDEAVVTGNVSTLSGDIDKSDSAQIGGDVVRGPDLSGLD
jgi:hypothetical protein